MLWVCLKVVHISVFLTFLACFWAPNSQKFFRCYNGHAGWGGKERRAVVNFVFDLISSPDLEANQARCTSCCEGKVETVNEFNGKLLDTRAL